MKLSIRIGTPRTLLRAALAATLAGVAACGSDSATGVRATPAQIRIVNSVFQYIDATSAASKTAPVAIDVLVDSSTDTPGMAAIPPNSIAAPSGSSASGYAPVTADVHTFVARLAGTSGPTSTFFTNATTNLPYLPHQYLTSSTPYTLVLAGIIPATSTSGANTFVPSTAVPFTVLTDDPFPPPQVSGAYQARFRVINAAPFTVATGLGATLTVYVTPGPTPPTAATLPSAASASAPYRNASIYLNDDAGTYVLTLTIGTGATAKIVAQSTITLAAGDVRSYVVQSTGYAAVPSIANATITSLLDNKY